MFLNVNTIKKNAKNREIIFWGCSEDWVPKTKSLFPIVNKIIDINNSKIGAKYGSLKCLNPKNILNNKKKYFIIVTSGSTDSIDEALKERNWTPGKDYAFSPVFYDFKEIKEFENLKLDLILSSSDYPIKKNKQRSSRLGGGLYLLKINSSRHTLKKVIEGSIRQFHYCEKDNLIYAIEYVKCEILIINKNFKVQKRISLNINHMTGITVYKNHIIVMSSADDNFIFLNKNSGKIVKKVNFGKKSNSRQGLHHINDCWVDDGNLYFSYFSKSGFWKNDIYDGGISVLELDTDKITDVVNNLFQPHTPTIINNSLHFFESTIGKFYTSSNSQTFRTNGFLRGLDVFDENYVLGQSETLYMSRAKSLNHILLNSGIYIYNQKSKLTRFYDTNGIKNIHYLKINKFK